MSLRPFNPEKDRSAFVDKRLFKFVGDNQFERVVNFQGFLQAYKNPDLYFVFDEMLGGPTSGHRGHKGVPGYRGGSMPSSGRANFAAVSAAVEKNTLQADPNDDHFIGAYESHRMLIPGDGRVIRKPVGSGTPYYMAENEMAAYDVSEALGFDLVPPTVLEKKEGIAITFTTASVQAWDDNSKMAGEYSVADWVDMAEKNPDQFRQLALFDAIINNIDRSSSNWLIRNDTGKIRAIDNAMAFGGGRFFLNDSMNALYKKTSGSSILKITSKEKSKIDSLLANDAFWKSTPLDKNQKGGLRGRLEILSRDGEYDVDKGLLAPRGA